MTDGNAPLNGPVNLIINIYDVKLGGAPKHQKDTTGVVAVNGVVNVPLGPCPSVSFDVPLFVGVRVDGGSELTPRSPLSSVPYALSVFGHHEVAAVDGLYAGTNVNSGARNNSIGSGVAGGTISG